MAKEWAKSESANLQLDLYLHTVRNSWIKHDPTDKQLEFLICPNREAFYGGAAGGGKSVALLMAALQYVDVPDYAAMLFRRTYADLALPGALMDLAGEWLQGTEAHWDDNEKKWTFPSGATISFGYMQTEKDKYRYKSASFHFVGFDELTEFSEGCYRYLFSRLRRAKGSKIPIRMRSASNPGDRGHVWVKQRFLIEGREKGRVFIPARLTDNPYIDATDYVANLDQLSPVVRAQLLNGDWNVNEEGATFSRTWFRISEAIPHLVRCVRFWDMASTEKSKKNDPDWTVGVKLGIDQNRQYYLLDLRRFRATPLQTEIAIQQTAQLDGVETTVIMEQEPGASGVAMIDHYRRVILPGYHFRAVKSSKDKITRAGPVASMAESGNVTLILGPWINDFLDEVESFPFGAHDDQVDALSGAFSYLSPGSQEPMESGGRLDSVPEERQIDEIMRRNPELA